VSLEEMNLEKTEGFAVANLEVVSLEKNEVLRLGGASREVIKTATNMMGAFDPIISSLPSIFC